ncbi:transposase [Streptomyces sp. NPDC005534]|uniref:transposase n=1 Tax=Streptomyces sp. NPDC005534 TaxID=3155714 RepID=UPI003456EC40
MADNLDIGSRETLRNWVKKVYTSNYRVYRAWRIWRELNQQGHAIVRCTVERLMREPGIQGAVRGKRITTTIPGGQAERASDRSEISIEPGRFILVCGHSGTNCPRLRVDGGGEVACGACVLVDDQGGGVACVGSDVQRQCGFHCAASRAGGGGGTSGRRPGCGSRCAGGVLGCHLLVCPFPVVWVSGRGCVPVWLPCRSWWGFWAGCDSEGPSSARSAVCWADGRGVAAISRNGASGHDAAGLDHAGRGNPRRALLDVL